MLHVGKPSDQETSAADPWETVHKQDLSRGGARRHLQKHSEQILSEAALWRHRKLKNVIRIVRILLGVVWGMGGAPQNKAGGLEVCQHPGGGQRAVWGGWQTSKTPA
jgi:hypothetical protein